MNFRNDAEAQRHAALHRPFHAAMADGYAARYGARAAEAVKQCRAAAARGDARGLQIHQHALSLLLYADQPQLFENRIKSRDKRA